MPVGRDLGTRPQLNPARLGFDNDEGNIFIGMKGRS
jgi:hypothetical protein